MRRSPARRVGFCPLSRVSRNSTEGASEVVHGPFSAQIAPFPTSSGPKLGANRAYTRDSLPTSPALGGAEVRTSHTPESGLPFCDTLSAGSIRHTPTCTCSSKIREWPQPAPPGKARFSGASKTRPHVRPPQVSGGRSTLKIFRNGNFDTGQLLVSPETRIPGRGHVRCPAGRQGARC